MKPSKTTIAAITLAIGVTTLTGCAKHPAANNDPLQGYNRVMFAFNQDLDHLTLRPAAKIYRAITPTPLQKGVTNAFANLGEVTSFSNDVLQGNIKYAMLDFWRFAVNTTAGIGGLFDVASRMGMPKHVETFGMTLAKWRGGKTSPYLVLPLYGPSTIQNAIGLVADTYTQPWIYLNSKDNDIAYSALGLNVLSKRANLLDTDQLVATAFDPYVFVRDAYMQKTKQSLANNRPKHVSSNENNNEAEKTS